MKINGFCLFEILITMCLITITCLALLKQQWQAMNLTNQQLLVWQARQHLVNACERKKAGLKPQTLSQPFQWHISDNINIFWQFHQQRHALAIHCSNVMLSAL